MKALLQRVTHSNVVVAGKVIAEINSGMMILVAIEKHDSEDKIARMAHRILHYRLFSDANGKMNCNIQAIQGDILLVPQFTLAADTNSGNRASFSTCAAPEKGLEYFHLLAKSLQSHYPRVALGQFGADMQVSLCNDGPVTFLLVV